MKYLAATLATSALLSATSALSGTVVVPFTGTFDEANVAADPVDGLPAGDYDTIGGLDDVGLFRLGAGVNTFHGSIYSPDDPADVFLVEILSGFRLTGASINWGTNLPNNWYPGIPLTDYNVQSSGPGNSGTAPSWFFEESSPTPEIFTISNLWDGSYGEASKLFDAPALDVGPGIYSSLLANQSTACMLGFVPSSPAGSFSPVCVDGLNYTMTFTVESVSAVPLPAGLPLLIAGVGMLGLMRRRKN